MAGRDLLDDTVLDSYKTLLGSYQSARYCVGFPEALVEGHVFFETLEEEFSISFFRDPAPQRIGRNQAEAMANSLREAIDWLRFIHYATAYRANYLIEEIARGLNGRAYPTVAFCARALVELAAIFNLQLRTVVAKASTLAAIRPAELSGFVGLPEARKREVASSVIDAWSVIRLMTTRTRFNWLAARPFGSGDLAESYSEKKLPRELQQEHVLTAIDKMRMTGPCPDGATLRLYYEMLCDFVHPNVGSVALFIDEARPAGANVFRFTLRKRAESTEVVQALLSVMSVPVREVIKSLLAALAVLDEKTRVLRSIAAAR